MKHCSMTGVCYACGRDERNKVSLRDGAMEIEWRKGHKKVSGFRKAPTLFYASGPLAGEAQP